MRPANDAWGRRCWVSLYNKADFARSVWAMFDQFKFLPIQLLFPLHLHISVCLQLFCITLKWMSWPFCKSARISGVNTWKHVASLSGEYDFAPSEPSGLKINFVNLTELQLKTSVLDGRCFFVARKAVFDKQGISEGDLTLFRYNKVNGCTKAHYFSWKWLLI